nr:ribonuclease H-like domain-containing protein [Tanacetum cinerariifolium]
MNTSPGPSYHPHPASMVIVNGDSVSPIASASAGAEGHIPPKTAEQKLARENKLKAKSTLMLAIPDENLLKFHACKDANTNETINIAHSVFAASSKDQASTASYADDVMFSFFSNQFNAPLLDNEDLEQIDTDDLEEMDLKWQVAMLTIRVKRFIKKTRMKLDLNGKETAGFDRKKVECYNCHRRGHFARECRAPKNQGNRNRDAPTRNEPVDTSTINALVVQDGMGGYDWSFQAEEGLTNFVLMAYTSQGSSSLDSENLTKLINSQISAIDKTGLGYDGQMNESDMNDIHVNENEVLNNVVDSHESNRDDNQVNDRFKKDKGYHAVPPPYTGNYMPPRADLSFAGLDNFVFKSKVSETITSVPKIEINASKTSKDGLEKPKTVRPSAPVIEEWESDSEDKNVFKPKEVKKTVKPSLEKIEFVNSRNITAKNENKAKKPRKFSQSPRELERCLEIILEDDDDVIIEATPLSSRSPTIVDYKIYKEGRKSFFKIIRADGAWNMDTGASSHLNNSVTSLSTLFNSCMYPSISVGGGHSIPVTNTDHEDLNLITAPSPISHSFLVSQHKWHQLLVHPGRDVLCRLVFNNVISCNKEKPLILCHDFLLGKHVKLPFVSSNSVVTSCFDIIYPDV